MDDFAKKLKGTADEAASKTKQTITGDADDLARTSGDANLTVEGAAPEAKGKGQQNMNKSDLAGGQGGDWEEPPKRTH